MFQSQAVLPRLPMRTAAWRLTRRFWTVLLRHGVGPKKTDDDLVNNVRAHLENSFVVSLKDQVARGKRLQSLSEYGSSRRSPLCCPPFYWLLAD